MLTTPTQLSSLGAYGKQDKLLIDETMDLLSGHHIPTNTFGGGLVQGGGEVQETIGGLWALSFEPWTQ